MRKRNFLKNKMVCTQEKCELAAAIEFKPGPKPVEKFMPQKINLNATNGGTREFTLFLEDPLPEANEI